MTRVLLLMLVGMLDLVLLAYVGVLIVGVRYMGRNRAPFVVLPRGAWAPVVRELAVKPGDVVYDLGCGDGRVLMALRRANPEAVYVGVEQNPVIWLLALLRVGRLAKMVRADMTQVQLGKATRVFVYLGPALMAALEPKFARELPAGARVVSVQFALPQRRPDSVLDLENSKSHAAKLYVYNY